MKGTSYGRRWAGQRPAQWVGLAAATSLVLALRPPATTQQPDGAALYKQHCQSCHGATGVPSARMVALYSELKPLDSALLAGLTTDSIVAGLRNGVGKMKSYSGKLSDAQLLAVAKFVKTLGSAPAGP